MDSSQKGCENEPAHKKDCDISDGSGVQVPKMVFESPAKRAEELSIVSYATPLLINSQPSEAPTDEEPSKTNEDHLHRIEQDSEQQQDKTIQGSEFATGSENIDMHRPTDLEAAINLGTYPPNVLDPSTSPQRTFQQPTEGYSDPAHVHFAPLFATENRLKKYRKGILGYKIMMGAAVSEAEMEEYRELRKWQVGRFGEGMKEEMMKVDRVSSSHPLLLVRTNAA